MDKTRLSVIVTNYNYARYLPVAIESVLQQDANVELIVVDDGSTDASRSIIAAYGDRLKPILLDSNVGQGGGFNAGYAAAQGDLIMFLDADDFMLPGAARRIISKRKRGTSLYLYRMRYADEDGSLSGIHPARGFSTGDISELLRTNGRYHGTITSGMVFSRRLLQSIMPMETAGFRQGADGYLATLAPLYGEVRACSDTISAYRLHDGQHTSPSPDSIARRARYRILHDKARYRVLRAHSRKLGLPVAESLSRNDEYHIKERLISLMFDPDHHPIADDTVPELLRECRRIALQQGAGAYRYLRAAWWTLLLVLPPKPRAQIFQYEIHPASRPAWFTQLVRFLKRRTTPPV